MRAFTVRVSVAVVALFSIVAPIAASAATSTSFFATADTAPVSRGDFIRASMQAFRVALMTDTKKLSYTRIPKALEPYVQTAHELGYLKTFGTNLQPAKAITRGEAAEIVIAIENIKEVLKPQVQYKDVRWNTPQGKAIAIAIAKEWMAPESDTMFGATKPLLGKEANTLLIKASGGVQKSAVPVVRIRIEPRKPKLYPKQDVLNAVWQIMNDEFLYKERIKDPETAYRAIQGMIQSLDDPYTSFLPPEKAADYQKQLDGEVTGIGAQVEQKNGVLTIVSPLPGSPAEAAGLQPADEILAADDKPLTNMALDDAIALVRGARGSSVKLHIRRNGAEFDVTIVRDTIKTLEIQVTFQGSIAVVKLMQFGTTSDEKFREVMQEVAKRKPTGIILDVRNNPGGLLHAAEEVASAFLPAGSTYIRIGSKGQVQDEPTEHDPIIDPSVKMVVLINKGSASASEVIAGALQDYGRAKIVGEKSYGKGSVQQLWKLGDGSELKMTVADWRTPKDRKIDGKGVDPDVLVAKGSRDDQLLRALEMLR